VASHELSVADRLQSPDDGSRAHRIVWALLSIGCVAVLLAPRFLPFYDYPEWVLQGQIVHDLWTGAGSNGIPVAQLYAMLPVPVPNLAAPVGIALLAFVMPIAMAGRIFLVLGVLGFGYGYGFLVRRLQGQPTVLEFTGFIWAFGYFLDRGYVSYLFGLPIAFVGIGLAHQIVHRPAGRWRLGVLCALQVLAFLAHLVPWGVLVLVVSCYAVALYRSDRGRQALRLLATSAAPAALLIWYAAAAPEAGHLALYPTLRDKLVSLAETVQFFPRLDPYPGSVASFPAQLLLTVAMIGIVWWNIRRRSTWQALRTPLAAAALILATVAVLDPVDNVNSLTKPDQRLLLPAILLLLAAVPWKPARARSTVAVAGVVSVSLVLHGLALISLDAPLQRVFDAIDTVPDNVAVATLAVPSDGGCRPQAGPSIGIPSLKWFDVNRMLARHEVRADLQETSGVALRFDPTSGPGLTSLSTAASEALAAIDATSATYVEVFACPVDLVGVTNALAPQYAPLVSGDSFAIFQRSP
jgi:hypothetical protein